MWLRRPPAENPRRLIEDVSGQKKARPRHIPIFYARARHSDAFRALGSRLALSLLRLASDSHGRQIDTGAATESSKEPFILPELIW